MLRRKSSRSTHRHPLGRSKSTSSIAKRRPEFVLDTLSAERDAYIAANLSYHHAHGHPGQHTLDAYPRECSRGLPLRRSNSVNGRLECPRRDIPRRQQSVRFTGPNAGPRRLLAARAKPVVCHSRLREVNDGVSGRGNSYEFSSGSLNYEQSITTSYTSRAGNSSLIRATGHSHSEPMSQTPVQPFLGSLRKSKSMYSQSTISISAGDDYDTQPDRSKPMATAAFMAQHQSRQSETERHSIRRSLRTPKSMSYLDFQSTQTDVTLDDKQSEVFPCNKAAHSKGSFRRLKSQSSMFFRSKHSRQESSMGLSASLRNSSDNSAAVSSAFSGDNMVAAKHNGIRYKARRVSKTVRNKLSRLFGRSKSTDTSRAEMGSNPSHDTDSDSFCRLVDSPPIEEASMSRVTSRVPSLHAVPSYQQMRSCQGSLESVLPEEAIDNDDKSRVTSWTSSTANTVISYGTGEGHEYQKRLSVIKENDMHIPSAWRTPTASNAAASGMIINSQRVYSALMKKLTNTPNTAEGAQYKGLSDQLPDGSVPLRQSSLDQIDFQPWSPPTIRSIDASEDNIFEDTREVASPKLSEAGADERKGILIGNISRNPSYKAYPGDTAGDGKGLSPAKLSLPRSASKQSSSCVDRYSTFSPSSDNHFFRTTSPYRKTLQRSMKEYQDADHTQAIDARYLSTLSALSLPSRRPSTVGSERDMRLAYTESFYSFNTEELSTAYQDGITPAAMTDSPADLAGDMTVPAEASTARGTPIHGRDISAASSVEWKTWLSAHVSKLETPRMKSRCSEQLNSATRLSVKHVRENAEIESSGETPTTAATNAGEDLLDHVRSPRSIATRTSLAKAASPSKSAEKAEQTSIFNKKEKRQHSVSPTAPPIPRRNVLRSVPSLSKLDSAAGPKANQCTPGLLRMRSLNTIPTAVQHPQVGSSWKQGDQENTRAEPSSVFKSNQGLLSTTTRPASDKMSSATAFGSSLLTCQHTPEGSEMLPPGLSKSTKSEWDAQIRGSRRMVDLFLSSRRKAIHGTMSRNGSENFATAFL